jgi:hypothetical protein
MLNEGNQIHNFMSSSGSGSVINYASGSGSGSDFLTSYSSGSGSGSKSQKVTVPTVPTVPVPVPVPQHCSDVSFLGRCVSYTLQCAPDRCVPTGDAQRRWVIRTVTGCLAPPSDDPWTASKLPSLRSYSPDVIYPP